MEQTSEKSLCAQTAKPEQRQTADYNDSSYCQNKGHYAEYIRCVAEKTDCIFYEIKKKDGEEFGVCRKRYRKNKKKQQSENDMKNIQDISTYTGR